MNSNRQHVRIRPMHLQEALLAACIGMALAGSALELGVRSWKYSSSSATLAYGAQETVILSRAWREFVHDADAELAATDDGRLAGGTACARITHHALVLDRAGDSRTVPIPRGMTASLVSEPTPHGPTCYVLHLTHRETVLGKLREHNRRIVACRQGDTP